MALSGGTKIEQYQAAGRPYTPPNRPFESIEEMAFVLGMTPEIMERIRPYVSVYKIADTTQPAIGAGNPGTSFDPDTVPTINAVAPRVAGPDIVVRITAVAANTLELKGLAAHVVGELTR